MSNADNVRSQAPPRHGLSVGPSLLIGGVVAVASFELAAGMDSRLGCAIVVWILFAWANLSVSRHVAPHARFLPLMRLVVPIAAPLLALLVLGFFDIAGLFSLTLAQIGFLCVLGALCAAVVVRVKGEPRRPRLRVAVVGSAATTADLRAELASQTGRAITVVGHIAVAPSAISAARREGAERPIGALGDLAQTVVSRRLDLLLVSSTVPRMSFFNEMEATCAHLDVRVLELSAFYEHTFGHVPLRAINAAWFQWVMHPRYSSRTPTAKRLLDLAIAAVISVVALPLIGLLALIVRLGGGPAFYRQTRIGEGGEPFQMIKLRSMRVAPAGSPARWSSADDERVTRVGRLIRRTHFDELPQLLNVIKGEMSIVGPRPEQPSFVEALEESVPFYSRRHVVRPGITGWAQVGCGYAGSHEGTLWKLSHDLYYLKHRSVTFDLLIIGETARMLFSRSQFPADADLLPFVHQIDQERSVPAAP